MMIEKLQAMGLNLMPLRHKDGPDSKLPFLSTWKHLQSEKYTGEFPKDHNFAVITGSVSGNLLVLDLDHESLYEKFSEYHDKTFIVRTGKKGHHLYFHYEGITVKSKKLFDSNNLGIDLKADGGCVVAPSCTHPETKKLYEIISDKPILKIDLHELQAKLQGLGFNVDNKSFKEIAQGITMGNRNDATFKYACYMIREHKLYGAPLALEMDKLNARHDPPLTSGELEVIISSATKYESKHIQQSMGISTLDELKKKIKNYLEDEPEVIDLSQFQEYTRLFKRDTIETLFNESARKECKFTFGDTVPLQKITPELENVPVQFECMIIAAGERHTYTEEADFECPDCQKIIHVHCDQFYKISQPTCKDDRIKCLIKYDTRKLKYIQQIRVQEFLENARNNTPLEFDAEILDDNVGEAYMGDRKTFIGKFRSIPTKQYNQIVFEILEMYDLDQKVGCLPTEEELAKWKADPYIYDKVITSMAPELYLKQELKETCMLSMAGGISLNGKRSNIHTAFIGDAQLAKSELLVAVNKIMVGSAYAVGRQASNAGLTVGMTKLYNGTMVPRAGLLPTHTGNLVCLDEVDKMQPEDREGILECMEQGTATLNKAGYPNTRLPTDVAIIAAGNPKNGKFNPEYPSVMQNFNLETPFITRFDLLWLLIDGKDEHEDEIIRQHIRNHSDENNLMQLKELQRYFAYVRSIDATVPNEIRDKIDIIHKSLRQISDLNELEIGWRLYYGLYRMVSACATLHLRTEATMEDIDIIERIVMAAINSLKIDGKIKMKTQKQTKTDIFLTTWNKVSDNVDSVDRDKLIKELGKIAPYNHLSAVVEFEKYNQSGKIELVNQTGRYKFV